MAVRTLKPDNSQDVGVTFEMQPGRRTQLGYWPAEPDYRVRGTLIRYLLTGSPSPHISRPVCVAVLVTHASGKRKLSHPLFGPVCATEPPTCASLAVLIGFMGFCKSSMIQGVLYGIKGLQSAHLIKQDFYCISFLPVYFVLIDLELTRELTRGDIC